MVCREGLRCATAHSRRQENEAMGQVITWPSESKRIGSGLSHDGGGLGGSEVENPATGERRDLREIATSALCTDCQL